jgi:hypothetical protein
MKLSELITRLRDFHTQYDIPVVVDDDDALRAPTGYSDRIQVRHYGDETGSAFWDVDGEAEPKKGERILVL